MLVPSHFPPQQQAWEPQPVALPTLGPIHNRLVSGLTMRYHLLQLNKSKSEIIHFNSPHRNISVIECTHGSLSVSLEPKSRCPSGCSKVEAENLRWWHCCFCLLSVLNSSDVMLSSFTDFNHLYFRFTFPLSVLCEESYCIFLHHFSLGFLVFGLTVECFIL